MEAKNIKNALNEEGKLAVIRVRGETGIKSGIKVTLNMLSLYRKNFCIVVPKNKDYSGMVMKAKDYITWGEINNETLKELIKKRGEESGRVHVVGAPALDVILNEQLPTREELCEIFNLNLKPEKIAPGN